MGEPLSSVLGGRDNVTEVLVELKYMGYSGAIGLVAAFMKPTGE